MTARPFQALNILGVLILTVYGFLSFSLILDWPPPWPDESQFAEPAYTLSQTGHLQSSLVPGLGQHVYWQPPGYFIFLAVVIRIVGFDLIALRAASIILGGLILILVYMMTRHLSGSKGAALFAMCLLAINPHFVTYVKLVRMDGLSVFLQLAGVFLVVSGRSARSPARCVASGTLLAAAAFTHPLGIIGWIVGVLHIVLHDSLSRPARFRALSLFLAPSLVAGAAYMWYATLNQTQWQEQLFMQFRRKARPPWESLYNLILRYRTLPLFVLVAVWGITAWIKSRLWRRSAGYRTLGIAAGVALVAVSCTFELPYHVYLLPWLSIAIALAILEWRPRWNPIHRRMVFMMLVLVGVNLSGYSLFFIYRFHWSESPPPPYGEFYARVSEHLPFGAQTLLYGYPDGFWALRKERPDLRTYEGVVFNEDQRRQLSGKIDAAVIARVFDPVEDSLSLFADVSRILGSPLRGKGLTVSSVGSMVRYHPSAWIIRWEASGNTDGVK